MSDDTRPKLTRDSDPCSCCGGRASTETPCAWCGASGVDPWTMRDWHEGRELMLRRPS